MIRVAAILFLCACAGVVVYSSPPARSSRMSDVVLSKLEQFQLDGAEHVQAMIALFVDDCGGTNHSPGNGYPPELLEPHPYSPAPLADPFSPNGEPVRFIQQHNSGNSAKFVFVSRGPDGDWDMDRLTRRVEFRPMVIVERTPPSRSMPDSNGDIWLPVGPVPPSGKLNESSSRPEYEHHEYTDDDGVVHAIDPAEAIVLPGHPNDRPFLRYELLVADWAIEGVSIYDPTNGALSDGDLLLVGPELYR